MSRRWITVDGNEATASVAHRGHEVIAIYPITPSSTMGELADEWSAKGRTNIWGQVPTIVEMQSEGGVAGAVHGALQAGSLTTTFTASQGLLLMLPNLYKIAGELTPFVLHVTARTLATHALSIFGDHSDVMACRQTGMAMLCSGSVQQCHDLALVAQVASHRARVPFLHFFDGFRTSHEIARIEELSDEDLLAMLPDGLLAPFRARALTPDAPTVRGTAQNPDVFFQAREASNPFHDGCAGTVQSAMDALAERVGRRYRLFDYAGHPEAERVVVVMGSAGEVVHETVEALVSRGERVGVVKVRLYRPFAVGAFVEALPRSARAIAVLDRAKEPGAVGEPLYQDVVTALAEARAEGALPRSSDPRVVGGRYGLASKEFTPAMARDVFDELARPRPRPHFTVGIVDDVTGLSLPAGEPFELDGQDPDVVRAVFYGLGADGTVGANKNSIKIIGEETGLFAQAYFVYDSKKSGAVTVSHLRFGPRPLRSSYLVRRASFVACHQYEFLDRTDVLGLAEEGATFLLNAPHGPDRVWDELSRDVQREIVSKRLRLFVIDAFSIARAAGMGRRINTIMQTCFFALSGVLPRDEAIGKVKESIRKTYARRGDHVVEANFASVDRTLAQLYEVEVPGEVTARRARPPIVSAAAPDFVKRVTAVILAGEGDRLPVSAFPPDGTWPTGTSKWEKRNIAEEIPVWDEALCIQCNKCAMVCPHAAVRVKTWGEERSGRAPPSFKSARYKAAGEDGVRYTVQVAPEDCTGCSLCVAVCPAKDKSNPKHKALDMLPQRPLREQERANYAYFLDLPEVDRTEVKLDVKGVQFFQPLFEYSGACSGCGETPYIKLLTQLFGDRALIANATGCSSIYGGNLPTTPYTTDREGRGPAWSNSLFEDNAEFGLGMRVSIDQQRDRARALLAGLAERGRVPRELGDALLAPPAAGETEIRARRERVDALRQRLGADDDPDARRLVDLAGFLVPRSVWIVGGDGWAYDIGYGGLDHVLSLGRDVNLLVLDTEVYSNTGGQQSKATPIGAAAKFAAAGKATAKKDLGLMAMAYGDVYVAHVAFGAKDAHTVKAFVEAESYPGTSLIIAYSHCIAHGYDLSHGLEQQKLAVDTGHWPLFRYDPRRAQAGEPALVLDSGDPKAPLDRYTRGESRYRMAEQAAPERFRELMDAAQEGVRRRHALYRALAARPDAE